MYLPFLFYLSVAFLPPFAYVLLLRQVVDLSYFLYNFELTQYLVFSSKFTSCS
jgi:hypothetical protein